MSILWSRMLQKLPYKNTLTGLNVSLVLLGNSSSKCKTFYDCYQNVITDGLDKYDPLIHSQLMEFMFLQRIPGTHDLPELMFNPKLLKHLEEKSISHVPVSTTELRLQTIYQSYCYVRWNIPKLNIKKMYKV